jgi:hypothetical protein
VYRAFTVQRLGVRSLHCSAARCAEPIGCLEQHRTQSCLPANRRPYPSQPLPIPPHLPDGSCKAGSHAPRCGGSRTPALRREIQCGREPWEGVCCQCRGQHALADVFCRCRCFKPIVPAWYVRGSKVRGSATHHPCMVRVLCGRV